MRKALLVSTAIASFFLSSCFGYALKIPINKNKLGSSFTMEFPAKSLTVKADEYFNLSDHGLEANSPGLNKKLLRLTTIDYAYKAFKKNKLKNYDVIIKNPRYAKPYYGKIAFINTSSKKESAAVSRFRDISIESSYFESATKGRTAIVYEYYEVGGKTSVKIPTWILLMSDEPF